MPAGFTIIRNVRDTARFGTTSNHLLLILATYADGTGRARPSVDTIARSLEVSRRHVFRLLAALVDDGYLIAEKRVGLPTVYIFRDAHTWLNRPSLGLVQGGAG